MENILILIALLIPFSSLFILALMYLFRAIRQQKSTQSKNPFRLVVDVVTLPFSFSKIFLQKRKERDLPLYFQLFLRFTRFCSRVPYFHFLPKFIVAISAEFLIYVSTGEQTLTALVYTWSILFFLGVTAAEGLHGELEEEVVTLANKVFLYTVSVLTLICYLLWLFFWKFIEAWFDNPFFRFMGEVAHQTNHYLKVAAIWAWELPILVKILIILVITIYIFTSLYLSKKGIK